MTPKHDPGAQRRKLIETAGQVFGETGFRNATIRLIARRAGVGLGAVHYHFEDKVDLYRAVCRHALETSIVDYKNAVENISDPKLRLRRWIDVFLANTFSNKIPRWQSRLVLRGMAEPGPEMAEFVETLIQPHHEILSGIFRELLGPGAGRDAVLDHTFVFIGQCIVHHHFKEVIGYLRGEQYQESNILQLKERLERIALAGVEAELASVAPKPAARATRGRVKAE